ncbi:MAG: hypothetical protein K6G94_03865 [Kiritimatiellae bacterium]|nr:hypothetical protein [Kiritimatiellia bacterium]
MNTRTIVSAIAECLVVASAFGEVTVDLAAQKGDVNPRLHSAHFCPRYSASAANTEKDAAALVKLNLAAWRSHDAPLVAKGQRVVDTHFIFPLLHLDAKLEGDHLKLVKNDRLSCCFIARLTRQP